QPDLFSVDNEDVPQAVGGVTDGVDRKALSVERMRGIDYFHGVRGSQMRLADWGINLVCRSSGKTAASIWWPSWTITAALSSAMACTPAGPRPWCWRCCAWP